MGAAILASLPVDVRALVEPYIPAIVLAIHQAFSLATASTFAVGIVTCVVASVLVLTFRESRATVVAPGLAGDGEPVADAPPGAKSGAGSAVA